MDIKINKLIILSLLLLSLQLIVNLVGALGPELAFDALWYHLTLPKIYLLNHSVSYIPGGLFYYSVMPKLTEMLYVSSLVFQGEILAKIIHFLFGIFSIIVVYKISRKYLSPSLSLIVCILFYSNLVVAWESITAYVDLARTFFEAFSLYFLLEYIKDKKVLSLVKSGIVFGLAISAKVLALTSLLIFIPLIIYLNLDHKVPKLSLRSRFNREKQSLLFRSPPFDKLRVNSSRDDKKEYFIDIYKILKDITLFVIASLIIPLPWFLFAYLNTHNPVYPFFTIIYPVAVENNLWNIQNVFKELFSLFVKSPDPISPIYLICLPVIALVIKKFNKAEKVILIYSILSIVFWLLTPRTGGGRFILPYLPALSVLVVLSIKILKDSLLKSFLIFLIIATSITSIFYRGFANAKYLPVIFGKETKQEFLKNNLNFSFGDYYDTDAFIKNRIKPTDKILIIGIHNLYYVDFPFVHHSFATKNEQYNYILLRDDFIPKVYRGWKLIYKNDISNVGLYAKDN